MSLPSAPRSNTSVASTTSTASTESSYSANYQRSVITPVAAAVNEFGFKVIRRYLERHGVEFQDLLVGPFELFTSLLVLLLGAKQETEAEIVRLLHLEGISRNDVVEGYKKLIEHVVVGNNTTLELGNTMYVDESAKIEKNYEDILKNVFELKPKNIPFCKIDEALKMINGDASSATSDTVDDLVAETDIKPEKTNKVDLVLATAVFYRGHWEDQFTHICFKSRWNGSESIKVDLMSKEAVHNYVHYDKLRCQVVSMPYETSHLRFMLLLPDDPKSDASYLIKEMNDHHFQVILSRFEKRHMHFVMPRFAYDAKKITLQGTLKDLGLTRVFEPDKAQLSGISSRAGLHLHRLVHRVFIMLDDRGSSTSRMRPDERILMGRTLGKRLEVIADRPFAFAIYEKRHKLMIFWGLYRDPKETQTIIKEGDVDDATMKQILAADSAADVDKIYAAATKNKQAQGEVCAYIERRSLEGIKKP